MRKDRVLHIARQVGALAVTAVTAAATLNGYRPLARRGRPSIVSFGLGLVVSEFPLQTLVSQLGGLALTARRMTRPMQVIAWLVAAISAVGLLNFNRAGHRADAPLREALDRGLGADRRTDSTGLWRRPAGAGSAKNPGAVRMLRIYRDYTHDGDISYGEFGSANHLDIWRRPDLDPTGKAPVLFQVPGELLEQMVMKQPHATNFQAYAEASPVNHVAADAPPFFVLHGTNDSLVPVEQARAFVARLRDVSTQPVVYAELPFAQHAFDMLGSARAAHAAVAVEQFLAEVYANRQTGSERVTSAS